MQKLDIGCSPLTDRIFIGGVLKSGGWAANKTDVTGAACASVAIHVLAKGGTVIVSANGEPAYEISAKPLKARASKGGENE